MTTIIFQLYKIQRSLLHCFDKFQGVIFSLAWDWKTFSLCSTSDDRSVRLWEFAFPEKANWQSSTVTCSNVFYGHTARVWRSLMFDNFIVSVGEVNFSKFCVDGFFSRQKQILISCNYFFLFLKNINLSI